LTGLLGGLESTLIKSRAEVGHLSSPVLFNSIPKSGTNLLKNILVVLPNARVVGDLSLAAEKDQNDERLDLVKSRISDLRPGCIYGGHIPYSTAIADWLCKHEVKQLFLYRDPRDVTVSLHHYVMEKRKRHAYYELYASLGSNSDRLFGTICGVGEGQTVYKVSQSSIPNVKVMFDAFEKWLKDENTFPLRYEDLMNPIDNGAEVVTKLLEFLNVPYNQELVETILSRGKDPSKSRTFRRGGSGAWREEYSEKHVEVFRRVAGDLLERWGYAWD
ncbi:MAG TPA: sulfotransferase domain-containing protein, partial [Anaerolineales bacterium]|nr:sulfotransferase domain-containing protein [Anaerolineales bacterium]